MIEKFPLDKVNEAYARMTSGKAQSRIILTIILRLPDLSQAKARG
jgi:D-arabinose 1-dehydrogenase-like Zn-dependent alcohol dehydrogenase